MLSSSCFAIKLWVYLSTRDLRAIVSASWRCETEGVQGLTEGPEDVQR